MKILLKFDEILTKFWQNFAEIPRDERAVWEKRWESRSPLLKYIYNVEKDAATENWETSLQMLLYQMPGRTAIRKALLCNKKEISGEKGVHVL